MKDAERQAIEAAARKAAEDAPPLSADQLEMLRHDRCPVARRTDERGAA